MQKSGLHASAARPSWSPGGSSASALPPNRSNEDLSAASSYSPQNSSLLPGGASASHRGGPAGASQLPAAATAASGSPPRAVYVPTHDPDSLKLADASPRTTGCNPGPAQAAFVERELMTVVAPALAKLLEGKPANPVHDLTTQLRDAVAEARRRPSGRRGDTLGAVASMTVPVLLDSASQPPSLNHTLTQRPMGSPGGPDGRPQTAEEAATERQWRHDLHFVSRPCAPPAGRPLPARFQRSGQHPVFGMDLPTVKELSLVVRHLVAETGAKHIKWVVAGVGDVLVYQNGRPYRATPTPQQWQALRERVDNDEAATQSATGRRSAFSVGNPLAMHAALEAECIKSIQQSVKALQAAEARRNARRAARENAAAAAAAAEPADVLLSVTVAAEAERATTPATPQRSRYAGAMDNSVISFESAVKAATAEIRNVSHSFAHFQHPDDAVSPPVVAETVTSLCDGIPDRHHTAVVIVGSDRWSLVRHLQALFTLYYVVESEVQHVKRLINASDAAAGASQQTFAADIKKEVASRRRRRDDRREWLVKAHAAALHEGSGSGGGSGEAANILERRTGIKQQRNQRRRKDDVKRKEVDEIQREHARRKIGGLTRIYRRNRGAQQGAAFSVPGPTFGGKSSDAVTKSHEQQAKDRRAALLAAQYREGEFPLIRKLLDALMEGFGIEFITDEPPMSASAKAFRQWSVSFRRVEPVDDLDVSSEEEEWSSSMAERVRHTVHTAFNPLHDAQMALKLSGSDDLRYMADIFDTCAGLASLQRKAMHAMERLGSMVQFAAFLGFHHKRRLGADFGTVIQSPLMSQLLRLPHKLQNTASPSYSDFLTASSAGQALLNHGCWVTPFLVNQPSLLHRPSSTRLLLGAPTPNGAFIPAATIPANPEDAAAEGSARAALPDMLQHLNPKTHFFLAPEHLSVDQWTDAVASALKRANGARRVLWLNTRPDMTVFVNEIPLVATARPEHVGHDSAHLPLYSSIRTANVNGSNPPAYLRTQGPLNVPGPADAYLNKQQAIAKGNPSRSGPASRRGSGSHGAVINARDMTLRSPTPTLGMDGAASEATGVTTVGALRRQKDHPSKDQPLPSGWLSLNIDTLERELCSEVMDMLEASEDGKLTTFTADAMVAGPGVPVAAVNTTLSDRPTQPVISTAAAAAVAPSLGTPGTSAVSPAISPMGNVRDMAARDFGKGGFPLPGTVLPPAASEPASPLAATKVPPRSVSPTPSARSEQPSGAATANPLGASVNMGASTQEPGRSTASGAALGPTAADLTAAIAAQGCAFPPLEDREVFVKPHALQVLRTRTKAPSHQPGQSFQSGPLGSMGQRGSAWSSSQHPNATQSLAIGDSDTDPTSSPANRTSGIPTGFGANADSLSFQVDTGSETSQRLRPVNDKTSDRASVARSLAPHRKTVRGVQMMRNRQGSVQSVLSDGHVADEDDSMLRLPSKAADACLTPWQAADEVRLRLKRRYSLDNAVQYRRAPMFRSNGPEWLKAIDQLYHLAHAQLADPYLAVVFGVSDADSLFPAVVCTIVWAVEHGKQAMLGVPESNLTGGNWETNTNGGFDASLFAAGTSNQLDFTVTPEQQPHSPFGTVHRLVEQHLKTEMNESLKFVDVLLQQTGLSEAIVAPIEHFMALAEAEAAKMPKDRPPTLPERQLVLWFAKKAAQALERYVLLILFHHFVKFVQEQRQVMSVMQVDFSFAEHIASLPGVLALLDDLDPWEGRADRSPLSPFSVAATANMRWRTRNWIATIG